MPDALAVRVRQSFGSGAGSFALDVDFRIERWPAVLFGPSGAGKSTLLRLLAGLERADAAEIHLGDTRLGSPNGPEWNLVQMVAQRPALFPHLNVAANVAFGLRHLRPAKRRERVQEMLALLGAEALADRMPAPLSGGERKRVAIARALAPGPKLLLLDEAFSGLDLEAKQEIQQRLSALLARRDIAALYVTHEVADAFALDAEVVVLRAGRIVAQGPPRTALAVERDRLLSQLQKHWSS